jgi:hypothetical protein
MLKCKYKKEKTNMSEIPLPEIEFDPTKWEVFDPLKHDRAIYDEASLNKDKLYGRPIRDFLNDVAGPEDTAWIHDTSAYNYTNQLEYAAIQANNELAQEAAINSYIDDGIRRDSGKEERRHSLTYKLDEGTNAYGKINRQPWYGDIGVIRVSPDGIEKVTKFIAG